MKQMSRPVRYVAVAGSAMVLASCGFTAPDSEPTSGSVGTVLPEAASVPAEWAANPLSTVWSAAPGIDLDSRPAQVTRAFLDGVYYIDAGIGMDDGYEGFTEFSGIVHNSRIPEDKPPVTGTMRNYIYEISQTPGPEGTTYSVIVCNSGADVAEWVQADEEWWDFRHGVFHVNFLIRDDPNEVVRDDRMNSGPRVQHPTANIFEGATYLDHPGELGRAASPEQDDHHRAECRKHVPDMAASRVVDGPIKPEPWFPGWPGRSD